MHSHRLDTWAHDHVFDQDRKRAGETRTLWVIILTTVMMVVEISAGLLYHSMALLADGLHMGSHATALGITLGAYVLARKLATDQRFTFGVGKIDGLAGFASAVMLLGFALVMLIESVDRLIHPVAIAFDQALAVAVLGLLVNGVSAWILVSTPHQHGDHEHKQDGHAHEHNLRAAYLHVIADALTSILAIGALLAGKYFGANWLDPTIAVFGAALIMRWSYGLIRETARILLDCQADEQHAMAIRDAIEQGSTDRVSDLHVWSIGHDIFAAEIAVVSDHPQGPDEYKAMIPSELGVVHATVEVHRCKDH